MYPLIMLAVADAASNMQQTFVISLTIGRTNSFFFDFFSEWIELLQLPLANIFCLTHRVEKLAAQFFESKGVTMLDILLSNFETSSALVSGWLMRFHPNPILRVIITDIFILLFFTQEISRRLIT